MRTTIWIVIALMLFGGVCNALTATGAYNTGIETTEVLSQTDVEQLTESISAAEDNALAGISVVGTVIRVVFGGILTAIVIVPTLVSMGVPIYIAMIFQVPIWVIYGVELISWWKGMNGTVSN